MGPDPIGSPSSPPVTGLDRREMFVYRYSNRQAASVEPAKGRSSAVSAVEEAKGRPKQHGRASTLSIGLALSGRCMKLAIACGPPTWAPIPCPPSAHSLPTRCPRHAARREHESPRHRPERQRRRDRAGLRIHRGTDVYARKPLQPPTGSAGTQKARAWIEKAL